LRKGLIAKTPRVTSCAGAAGVGSVFGMVITLYQGILSSVNNSLDACLADPFG